MISVLFSLFAYVAFFAVFGVFVVFTNGIWIPHHVDATAVSTPLWAALVNVGLVLAFGLQHSLMARQWFKQRVVRVIAPHLERSVFVLASALVLAFLMWQWRAIPTTVWKVEYGPGVSLLWLLNALGWLGVPVTSFLIDHFDLFGLKQSFSHWRKRSYEPKGFVTPWLYRYVRHPMMTSILVAFWATPHMTVGHLLLATGMSIYIVVGVHFEERSLRRELGLDYLRFQGTTPKFFPRLLGGRLAKNPSAPSDSTLVAPEVAR